MAGYNYNFNSILQTAKNVTRSEVLIPARVVDIVLDDKHPEFEQLGSWGAIGVIKYKLLNSQTGKDLPEGQSIAYPLQSHIKHIPLKNEIVLILSATSEKLNSINTATRNYYLDIVNLWNHPHHNALPTFTDNNVELGDTFIEAADINPMQPFEGDIIFEGRQGQSLRFSSTTSRTPWKGTPTAPIIIISNGQIQTDNGFEYITEDINKDSTSIYLTSNQGIKLEPVKQIKITSFDYPEYYNKSQLLGNSDRVVLNAKTGDVSLFANTQINLCSEGIYLESSKHTVLESTRIDLGDKATESVILGDVMLKQLTSVLTQLIALSTSLSSVGIPQVTAAAQEVLRTSTNFISNVEQMKSKKVKVGK